MARYNLEIKVGTYTGNGVDATNITGTYNLQPRLAIVKGGANNAVFKTRRMPFDSTGVLGANLANITGGVKGLMTNGFQVGTAANVNTNTTAYYYLTIGYSDAQQYARAIEYTGTGGDARQLTNAGLFFQPDFFFTKGDTTQNPSTRSSDVSGDNAWHFSGSADAANEIQNFVANGVELGTSARTNSSNLRYYAFGMKKYPGILNDGTFTGDGVDNRTIEHGLGTTPDFIIIKNGTLTTAAVIWLSTMTATQSASMGAAAPTTGFIKSVGSSTFTIGSSTTVNGSGNTVWWVAGKAGTFNVPLTRTAV